MKQSSKAVWIVDPIRSMSLVLAASALMVGTAHAQDRPGLETTAVLRVEDSVPPDLMRGPHHTVDPTVYVHSFMREYRVRSEFGDYDVVGDAELRTLVKELAAIAELRKVKRGDVFVDATKNAVGGTFRAARNLIEDPVDTISGVPEAAGDIFSRLEEQVRRRGGSQYEDGTAKSLLAVSSFKRELARKLEVDVYSTNEVLQKELNSVAWASAAGNLSLGAVSLATGAAVLQLAGYARVFDQAKAVIEAEPPAEVSRRSRQQLTAIGIPKDLVDRFLENRSFSPRHQYIIVTSLELMAGVANRRAVLDAALTARSEREAHLFQQTAALMAGYHQSVAPIARISSEWGFPVAIQADARVTVLAPLDYVQWNATASSFLKRLPPPQTVKSARRGTRAVPRGEIWLTGDASARTRQELERHGYDLHERSGRRIAIAD